MILFLILFLILRHFNGSQIILKHFNVEIINISNARLNKVVELQLLSYFRSFSDVSSSGESHRSIFGAEVCGDEDRDFTHCFHRRTGCSTFTNFENGLWMLIRQHFALENQSMTRSLIFVLVKQESSRL